MNFSFQLYSARSLAPISAIFPQLKALGYAQVEGFGGLYSQADELAAALKSSGLIMPTAHFELDQLKDISENGANAGYQNPDLSGNSRRAAFSTR